MAKFSTGKLARLSFLLSAKSRDLAEAHREQKQWQEKLELHRTIAEIHERMQKVYRKLGNG